jgi:hypothetical protein
MVSAESCQRPSYVLCMLSDSCCIIMQEVRTVAFLVPYKMPFLVPRPYNINEKISSLGPGADHFWRFCWCHILVCLVQKVPHSNSE